MDKEWQQVQTQQQELEVLFAALMNEKKKRDVISFEDEKGNIVEHYPDGTVKVLYCAY